MTATSGALSAFCVISNGLAHRMSDVAQQASAKLSEPSLAEPSPRWRRSASWIGRWSDVDRASLSIIRSLGDLRQPFFPIHETLKFKTGARAEEFLHEVILLDRQRKTH
jgi:hypothetical protein